MGEFINGIAVKGEPIFQIMEAEEAEETARRISLERKCPVLSAYIYDGDFWGFTLYIKGKIRNAFATLPEYFEEGEDQVRQYTADVLLLALSFDVAPDRIEKYLRHWTDDLLDEAYLAYKDDRYPYGDDWQMVDFLKALGFSYPEDPGEEAALQEPKDGQKAFTSRPSSFRIF